MCKEACNTLRNSIQGLVTKMDFATLDAWSKSVEDSELEQLRHPLDMVLDIAQAFLGLLEDAGHVCQVLFPDGYDGLNSQRLIFGAELQPKACNHMRAKTCLVSLRAIADKIPGEITSKAAANAAPLIAQGLVEQFLSWSSEAEAAFDAFKEVQSQLRRQAAALASQQLPAASRLYSYATKPSALELRRPERADPSRALDRLREEARRVAASSRQPASPFARVRVNMRRLEDVLARPSGRRFERLRPPRLVIPEASA
jgi:hypothetical protein